MDVPLAQFFNTEKNNRHCNNVSVAAGPLFSNKETNNRYVHFGAYTKVLIVAE